MSARDAHVLERIRWKVGLPYFLLIAAWRAWRAGGVSELWYRAYRKLLPYRAWYERYGTLSDADRKAIEAKLASLSFKPSIAVIALSETREPLSLDEQI